MANKCKSEIEKILADHLRQAIKKRIKYLELHACQVAEMANISRNSMYAYLQGRSDISTGRAILILSKLKCKIRIVENSAKQ